jgi:GMP synthase (glutamine-hydrolysing)
LNPRGREIGTVTVQLTEAGRRDPLFAWCGGGSFETQATHMDAVDPLPPSATLLASNENCAVQAFRLSETVAGVQFHPEASPAALRDLIFSRADKIRAEGRDPAQIANDVHDTDSGQLLKAFQRLASRG